MENRDISYNIKKYDCKTTSVFWRKSERLNNSCLDLVTLICYLRKSSLKHILTYFIHWSVKFIGKIVLRVVRMFTNWLVHSTWHYTTFWISFLLLQYVFFLFFWFSLETIHLGSLQGHLLVWALYLFVNTMKSQKAGSLCDAESMGDAAAAQGSRQCKESLWYFKSKSCFPKVMGIFILVIEKICLTFLCLLRVVH